MTDIFVSADSFKRLDKNTLIDSGADVLETDLRGWTPLHEVAHLLNLKCVKVLARADKRVLPQKCNEGCTALEIALRNAGAKFDEGICKTKDERFLSYLQSNHTEFRNEIYRCFYGSN